MIKLYKDGDRMGIKTDAPDEFTFMGEFATIFADMIEVGKYDGDWQFQLRFWLQYFVELCCKYRGYKADVEESRVLISGNSFMDSPLIAEIDNHDKVVYPREVHELEDGERT